MSSKVLARKWRPTKFDSLIGQDHVRKALSHALEFDRLHHAYLFSGTRGVGKTTIARILARCLNCETGITGVPCGNCANCISIDESRFIDLIEVDAASRTRVDDTRELLENTSYAPSQGRYKVYIIDEVHMLSMHSFNALLKTLEEPPAHAIFLLATTDPQKLPATVLSRCLQFHLRDVGPDVLVEHLQVILSAELIEFEIDALWFIAKAGRGSVRDALTLLDQAIAHGQGQLRRDDVIQMLGVEGLSKLPSLLDAVATGDAQCALQITQQLAEQTPDWLSLVAGLQELIHQVGVCQVAVAAIEHLSPSEQTVVIDLANKMGPEFLQLAYQFVLTGYRDLPLSTDLRSAFEMLVLRMIAFRPAGKGEFISTASIESERNEREPETQRSETVPFELKDAREAECDSEIIESETEFKIANDLENQAIYQTVDPNLDKKNSSGNKSMDNNCDLPISLHDQTIVESVKDVDTFPDKICSGTKTKCDDIKSMRISIDNWPKEAKNLGLRGMTGSLIEQTVLVSLTDKEVHLATTENTADLLTERHRKRIAEAFSQICIGTPSLTIETRDTLPETPREFAIRMQKEALKIAQESFQNDPFVRHLKQTYDGEINLESIKSRES